MKGLSYHESELSRDGIPTDTTIMWILTERADMFYVTQHQETKEIDTKDN